jgi:hypothetical protein
MIQSRLFTITLVHVSILVNAIILAAYVVVKWEINPSIASAFPSKVLGIGDERLGVQMRYSYSQYPIAALKAHWRFPIGFPAQL